MNCPICQQPLVASGTTTINSHNHQHQTSITAFWDCNSSNPDHGFSAFVENNHISIFSLSFHNWFITCSAGGWNINTLFSSHLASSTTFISPEEAHQLLLKYMKLKAFL